MTHQASQGPIQVIDNSVSSLNLAFAEVLERTDHLKGLRDRVLVFDRIRCDDPEQTQDALTQGASGITAAEERSRRYALLVSV